MFRLRKPLFFSLSLTISFLVLLLVGLALLKEGVTAKAASSEPQMTLAQEPGPGYTGLVSLAADEAPGNGESLNPSPSFDGQLVAFNSKANNLVPGDITTFGDIFIRHIKHNTTERVSLAYNGVPANGDSFNPSLSATGSRVAFASVASNLVTTTNSSCQLTFCADIFVRDRVRRTTIRVTAGTDYSLFPSISADGRWVVFESKASNLVTGDNNNNWDVFAHEIDTGVTKRLSVSSAGVEGNAESRLPVISGNGKFVVFYSRATNFSTADPDAFWDTFLYNMETGTIQLVSVGFGGAQSNGDSGNAPPSLGAAPSISFDGRWVSFHSLASNLVANDANGNIQDVFVHEPASGLTRLVSVSTGGTTPGDGPSSRSSLSGNGRWIVFDSQATTLVPNDTNGRKDVFFHDLETGLTLLASPPLSLAQPTTGDSSYASLSANGRFVLFSSLDQGSLVATDTNGVADVFMHDQGGRLSGRFGFPPLVTLQRPTIELGRVIVANANPLINEVYETPIASDGSFSLTVSAGKWQLKYVLFNQDWYGPPLNNGAPVEVGPGQLIVIPPVPLRTASMEFHALIRRPDGQPFTEARLVIASHLSDSQPLIRDFSYDSSSQDWTFTVPCGLQVLGARSPITMTSGMMVPERIAFDPCQGTPPQPFVLQYRPAPIVVSGTLFLDTGGTPAPIGGAYVWARNPHGGHVQVESDPTGRYEMRIGPGAWEFAARYEDSSGNRYGSPPQQLFLEPENTSVQKNFTLSTLSLPPLPKEHTESFPSGQDHTITLEDGTEIYIPANALSSTGEQVSITVTPLDAHLPRTDSMVPVDYGYEIVARDSRGAVIDGTFGDEVRLTFPISTTSTNVDTDTLRVLYFSHENNAYEEIDDYVIDESTGQIHAFVDHFSCWIRGSPSSLDEEVTFVQASSSGTTTLGAATTFTATSTPSQGMVFSWDFGDGTGGAGAITTHTYTQTGTYTVSLSAENGVSSVGAAPITVQVEDAEPPTYTLWLPLVRR